jgi:hypothetical protein
MNEEQETPHKRYLVFGFDHYYPSGGMEDLIGSFAKMPEAIEFIKTNDYDSYNVYDRIEGVEIDFQSWIYNN